MIVNKGVIFEFYLWNPSTEEYIGFFLDSSCDPCKKNSLNIVCHVGGTHKEKIVETIWYFVIGLIIREYEQELTVLIQAITEKSEVRVNGTRKKTYLFLVR